MQGVVQSGTVRAVISSTPIRISENAIMSEMHREAFRVTGTNLWLGDVGVDPADYLRPEQDRKRKRGEVYQNRRTQKEDLVETLHAQTRQDYEYMNAIAAH